VGDVVTCTDQDGNVLDPAAGWHTAPFAAAQDGLAALWARCTDKYGASSTSNITLNVVPARASSRVDTFSGINSNGYEVLTWTTYGNTDLYGQGCYVHEFDGHDVETTLGPAGELSGTSSSALLTLADAPYIFTLFCAGTADAGVPSIVVDVP
jgi:hypothetical protein